MEIQVERNVNSTLELVDFDNLTFGRVFSDHMFIADYQEGAWRSARIVPYGSIQIEPSLCSLHYGQAIFEGLKAFRSADGNHWGHAFRSRE